jgi:type II secretory pathway component PulF
MGRGLKAGKTTMDDSDRRHSIRWAMIVAVGQGMTWSALIAFLMFFEPSYEHIYRDFQAELPSITIMVFNLTHFLHDKWFLAAVSVLFWMVVNGVVVWLLDRSQSAAGKIAWYALTWLAAFSFLVLANFALVIPLVSLFGALKR